MEFLEGFLVTDIYLTSDYKLPTKLLPHLRDKLHCTGRYDSAKAPEKEPEKFLKFLIKKKRELELEIFYV